MSIRIIRSARRVVEQHHDRYFECNDSPGAGYGFPCSADGTLEPFTCEQARINYQRCIDGTHDVTDRGIRSWANTYTVPAIGRCHCGGDVILDGFTCPCESCGRDYNWAGQELASRSQWGEETGEHPADIARIL